MAAAPLTKTTTRALHVTFIEPPFITFELAILMRRRDKTKDIINVASLGKQTKIKYGIMEDGSTARFFKTVQTNTDYISMNSYLEENRTQTMIPDIAEAVRRVRASTDADPFAFIGENYTMAYYARHAPCELTMVPGHTASDYTGAYHLTVRKRLSASVQNKLANALNKLKQDGRLNALYKKWWIERGQCSSAVATSGTAILVPIVLAILSRLYAD